MCPNPKAQATPSPRSDGRWQFGTRDVLAETALVAAALGMLRLAERWKTPPAGGMFGLEPHWLTAAAWLAAFVMLGIAVGAPLGFLLRGRRAVVPTAAFGAFLPVALGIFAALEPIGWYLMGRSNYLPWVNWCRSFSDQLAGSCGLSPLWWQRIYVSIRNLPGWGPAALITFTLGLLRSRRAHAAACGFALMMAVRHTFKYHRVLGFYFSVGTGYMMAPILPLAAWFLGWSIRGRRYGSARKIANPWIRIPLQLLLVGLALAISLRGWWVITWWP